MPRYLSPAWLESAGEAVSGSRALTGADGERLVLEHIVEDAPDGDVAYHLELGGDGGSLRPGRAAGADVTFRQSYATACAVARGERSAKAAFLDGDVRVGGDVTRLLGRDDLFIQLDLALAPLRAETTF